MPTTFRLSEILDRRSLSQEEAARLSGLSVRTISRMYHNRTKQVSLATLDALAKALKIAPGDLIARGKEKR